MIRHLWTIFCSLSITDGGTQSVSLINVLERLQITVSEVGKGDARMVVPMPCEVVTLWERAAPHVATEGVARVEIVDSRGETLGSGEVRVDLTESLRCRSRTAFNAFPVSDSGRYVIRTALIESTGGAPAVINEYPFDVMVIQDPSAVPETPPDAGR
jgi:hypothetical protein